MKNNKYQPPDFIKSRCSDEKYKKWLDCQALRHVKRDKKRGFTGASAPLYKELIHRAVENSCGLDEYTGKPLRWDLIGTFNNTDAERDKWRYRDKFKDLPTVDHVDRKKEAPSFKICSWRVNDAKNDLTIEEFVELCDIIIRKNKKC